MLGWILLSVGILITTNAFFKFLRQSTQIKLIKYALTAIGVQFHFQFPYEILKAFKKNKEAQIVKSKTELEVRPFVLQEKKYVGQQQILDDLETHIKKGGTFNLMGQYLKGNYIVYLQDFRGGLFIANDEELYKLKVGDQINGVFINGELILTMEL